MVDETPGGQPEDQADSTEALQRQEGFSSSDLPEDGKTIQLREERLVAHKEKRHVGDIDIRTEIEEVPGRLEVDALQEEVEIEHVPVGRVVSERHGPHEDGDTLIVPVYEEQLVVSKRLILKEELRVRRLPNVERQLFEETLQRERLVIEESGPGGLIHERYPREGAEAAAEDRREGFLENLKRKVMTP